MKLKFVAHIFDLPYTCLDFFFLPKKVKVKKSLINRESDRWSPLQGLQKEKIEIENPKTRVKQKEKMKRRKIKSKSIDAESESLGRRGIS